MNGSKNDAGLIHPVKGDLSKRAPLVDVLVNWKLWWFPIILTISTVAVIAEGMYFSHKWNDWGFLGRSGAITTVLGSYLVGRPVWRKRFKSRYVTMTLIQGNDYTDEQRAEFMLDRTDVWFFYIGFVIAAVGSIIWGFADLLNCFHDFSKLCAIPTLYRQ